MGVTILAQWVDVAQRINQIRTHLRTVRRDMVADENVDTHYCTELMRISSELQNLEQEVSYVYETLLQAQAAIEYTGDWAKGSK